jgi:hypothetical protein
VVKKHEIIILAALLIAMPAWVLLSMNTPREREFRRYKRSLDLMYQNRAVLELWFRQTGRYPAPGKRLRLSELGPSLGGLGKWLVCLDGWQHEFVYIASSDGAHSYLVSPGRDGQVQFLPGPRALRQPDVGADIVLIDGRFAQVFEGWTECPEGIKNVPDEYLKCAAVGGHDCVGRLAKRCSDYDLAGPPAN